MPQEEDESLIIYLKKELEASLIRNDSMEKENQELRQEIIRLKAQISSLKAHDNERKTMLWKKLQNSNDNSAKPDSVHQKLSDSVKIPDQNEEHSIPGPILTGSPEPRKERQFPSPPPPKLTLLVSPPPFKEVIQNKLPPKSAPPPPPLPSKAFMGSKSVRRVPEVVEFYRQLTRKNTNLENKGNSTGTSVNAFTPNMIGEIENRSSHLSAIKSDVEERKDFINNLIKAVDSAAFKEISEVETFVKWLDGELSSLVDERAVLKHFTQWPERKADAIREAAFNYKDLKNLVSEISSFQDNPKESSSKSLKKMQALQDRRACWRLVLIM